MKPGPDQNLLEEFMKPTKMMKMKKAAKEAKKGGMPKESEQPAGMPKKKGK